MVGTSPCAWCLLLQHSLLLGPRALAKVEKMYLSMFAFCHCAPTMGSVAFLYDSYPVQSSLMIIS